MKRKAKRYEKNTGSGLSLIHIYQEAQNVRAGLEEQLAGMDPSDPDYSTVQQQLEQAQNEESEKKSAWETASQQLSDEQARLDGLDEAAATARAKADSAQKLYEETSEKVTTGRPQLEAARELLEQEEQKLTDGEAQLEAGKAQLAQAKAQIDSAQAQIAACLLYTSKISSGISQNANHKQLLLSDQMSAAGQEIAMQSFQRLTKGVQLVVRQGVRYLFHHALVKQCVLAQYGIGFFRQCDKNPPPVGHGTGARQVAFLLQCFYRHRCSTRRHAQGRGNHGHAGAVFACTGGYGLQYVQFGYRKIGTMLAKAGLFQTENVAKHVHQKTV